MSTQIKFAPFGIGIHSMDSDEAKQMLNNAKEKGYSFFKAVGSFALSAAAIATGVTIIVGGVAIKKSADVLCNSGNKMNDLHVDYFQAVKHSDYLRKAVMSVPSGKEGI